MYTKINDHDVRVRNRNWNLCTARVYSRWRGLEERGTLMWSSGSIPRFVAVRCPVVLLLLFIVRVLCWLVVVHGFYMWSLVAGVFRCICRFRGGKYNKWPPLGFQKWRHDVYRCGSTVAIRLGLWKINGWSVGYIWRTQILKLKVAMLHTGRLYGGNQVGLTCVLECWIEVLDAVYHSVPCGEPSRWLYNLLCLESGC